MSKSRANTEDSLFRTTVPECDLDPTYVRIRDFDECAGDREYLDRAWQFFRSLADTHFHDQAQRRGHFESRMWELRLAWTFNQLGFTISTVRPTGPDLKLTTAEGDLVHVEAVAPQPTQELLENERQSILDSAPIPEDAMILRATGVIKEKRESYRRHRGAGVIAPQDPYIVAISGANISQATMNDEIPWILKPLFGIGECYMSLDFFGRDDPTFGWQHVPIRATRQGSPIHAGLFADENANEVSAILFSPRCIECRPESFGKPCGDDFVLVHNPYAKNPVAVGILPCGVEFGPRENKLMLLNDWRIRDNSG
jgi:hypothetical protein